MWLAVGAVVAALVLVGCGGGQGGRGDTRSPASTPAALGFPVAPAVRDGPLDPRVKDALATLLPSLLRDTVDREALAVVADSGDAGRRPRRDDGGVEVVADAGGLRVRTREGKDLPAHQAFWFAWSQFNPGTRLWTRPD